MSAELKSNFNDFLKTSSKMLPTVQQTCLKRLHKLSRLGGGTYGRVYQATVNEEVTAPGKFVFVTDPITGQLTLSGTSKGHQEVFAVKRNFVSPVLQETIGSLRELDMLNLVKGHPFCIQLKDVSFEVPFTDEVLSPADRDWISDKVYFVLEKGDLDGDKYIRTTAPLINERKLFAVQLLLAVEFLHSRGVYHRDLKPANIICFLNSNGELLSAKLTDFGLSQHYCDQTMSVPGFVTLWYRAPEISLTKEYDFKVDVWSLGCILFELFSTNNRRFIQPSTEDALINSIIEKLPFSKEDYLLAQQLYPRKITRSYDSLQSSLRSIYQQLSYSESQIAQFNSSQLGGKPNSGTFQQLVDLLEHALVVDPNERWNTSQCLNHPFFDGFRELIDQTRTMFGINSDGEWTLKPDPKFIVINNQIRVRAMHWFQLVYSNRLSAPICSWYSHRILFHAIAAFDRYLYKTNICSCSEADIVVWINTFLFMSAKYFRVMVQDFGLNSFSIGIIPEELYLFKVRAQQFEERIIRDVFKYEIYEPTIFEVADDFLTETSIAYLLKLIMKAEIPSGTSLRMIWSLYSDVLTQANRIPSPIASPQTPVVRLSEK